MTVQRFATKLNSRVGNVEREFRYSADGIGKAAVAFCKKKLVEEIYAFPVPTSPRTGKPKYKRTRRLLNNERYELEGAYVIRVLNDMPYAKARHDLGLPGKRKTDRPAHWRDELLEAFRPILLDTARSTLRDIWRK